MKKGSLVLLVVSTFIFSCSKSSSPEPSNCGNPLVNEKELPATSTFVFDNGSWTEDNILTTLNGNERTFMVMLKQTDLCPDKYVDITYHVNTDTNPNSMVPVKIEGRAEWSESYIKTVSMCMQTDGNMKAGHLYEGILSADLKPAYNNTAGTVKAVLVISFFTLGNTTLDTAYFKTKFNTVKIQIAGNRQ